MATQPASELSRPATAAAVVHAETTPERRRTSKRPTFFQVRDRFDATLDSGELILTGPQNAVFRYLLEHAIYDPKRYGEDYGQVVESALSNEVIARRTSLSVRTIKSALSELAEMELVSRTRRPILTGGKQPDLIRVEWLFRKVQEMPLPEGAGDAPYEGAGDAPSSFVGKESTEESSSRADDEVVSTPLGKGSVRAPSGYATAVCQRLSEHLDSPLDPMLLPAAARDLLARLWPDPQDVPAREIGYGHMEDSWFRASEAKWGNEAAILAGRLRYADEDLVRSWIERGAQRLAEMGTDEAEREREIQAAKEEQECQEAARRDHAERDRKRQEQKAQEIHDGLETALVELAELRFGGDLDATREDLAIWGEERWQLEHARRHIHDAHARAGTGLARVS